MNEACVLSENKKYTLIDYIAIPFRVAPLQVSVILLNKLLSAIVPSLQVLAVAQFIDTAGCIFRDGMPREAIYLPLFLLMLIVAYGYLNGSLTEIMNSRAGMRMEKALSRQMLRKRASLDYRYIEDDDTWDLISRTCDDPAASILSGFHSVLGIAEIVCRIVSLLVIFMSQMFWGSLVILVLSVPLLFMAYRSGRAAYRTDAEAAKHSRRADYLQKVLSGRDALNERTVFGYTDDLNVRWLERYETARKIKLRMEIRHFVRMKGGEYCYSLHLHCHYACPALPVG